MQRSIWVDEKEWKSIKEWAEREERTISRYLVTLHHHNIPHQASKKSVYTFYPDTEGPIEDWRLAKNPRPKGQDGIKK